MSVVIESQKQLYDDVDAWCQQAGAGAADAGALDWDVTKAPAARSFAAHAAVPALCPISQER